MAHGQHRRPHLRRDRHQREVRVKSKYRNEGQANKFTVNAPSMFFVIDCVGMAVGMEYERFLDKEGLISLSLPVYAFRGSTFDPGSWRRGDILSRINGVYAAPAFMFHPLGNKHRVDISAGPAFLMGSINRDDREIDVSSFDPEKTYSRTDGLSALMGEFNMTVNTNGPFVFATHLGIGGILNPSPTQGAIVNFGIKLGARF
jgi:hypothetical protein